MKSYKELVTMYENNHQNTMATIKRHRRIWGIVRKHASAFKKLLGKTDMAVGLSYSGYVPCVDINIHLGKDNKISDIYPLVDAMIKDPRLTMVEPLPTVLEDTDMLHCDFEENTKKKVRAKARIYVFIANSKVCVQVGTGKYKEITRVACGHYDDEGNFVENGHEDNQ